MVIRDTSSNDDDITALDAALAKSLDRDVLAVFADRLQAVDDPRGELIAIDLEIERSGARAELVARRALVLDAWLGPDLAVLGGSVRFGFVEDLVLDDDIPLERVAALVATRVTRCIRKVTIIGDVERLESVLRAWSASDHPHLTWLELSVTGGDIPIEPRTLEALWARCPQLHTLTLRGDHVLERCTHPGVRRLVLTGFRALEQARRESVPMTSVEEIDFAFNDARGRDHDEELEMQALDEGWIYPPSLPSICRRCADSMSRATSASTCSVDGTTATRSGPATSRCSRGSRARSTSCRS